MFWLLDKTVKKFAELHIVGLVYNCRNSIFLAKMCFRTIRSEFFLYQSDSVIIVNIRTAFLELL